MQRGAGTEQQSASTLGVAGPATDTSDASVVERLIVLPSYPWRRGRVIAIVVLAVELTAAGFFYVSAKDFFFEILTVVVSLGVLAVSFACRYRTIRRQLKDAELSFSRRRATDTPTLIQRLGLTSFDQCFLLPHVVRLPVILYRNARRGQAIILRNPHKSAMTAVTPFEASFEPVALDDQHDSFWHVAGDDEADTTRRRARARRRGLLRWLKRPIKRDGSRDDPPVLALVITAVFLMALAGVLLRGRYVRATSLVWMFLFGILPIFEFLRRRSSPRAKTWAFPGGLAVPAGCHERPWVWIRREDGLLVYFERAGALVSVSNGILYVTDASAEEARFAFRAWLANCPPPTDEQLRSYFGSSSKS